MEISAAIPLERRSLTDGLKAIVALGLIIGALAFSYQKALTPVTLVVDGQTQHLRTHQETVGALLTGLDLTLHAEDIVLPPPETEIEPGLTIQIKRAHTVHVIADGQEIQLRTHSTSIHDILAEASVNLGPQDKVEISGALSKGSPSTRVGREAQSEPAYIVVHRATPYTLHEEGQATQLYSSAATVGEALRQAGMTIYLADHVQPGLGERLSPRMHVYVKRSKPVEVQVDGRSIRTRTHREYVGDVLADLGVVLIGQDYTIPPPTASLRKDTPIQIMRVKERFLIEQDPIPFDSIWQPNPDVEIDHQGLMQEGSPGVLERRIRVRYENGHEVKRVVEDEYVAVPPTTKIMGYGTKIVVRTLDTPSGPVDYWRQIRMLATSYSAGTSGTDKSNQWYGRTATGMKMRNGIVAVDPNVISLYSKVYVPGYGIGLAGDTGSAIKGNRIDLGYSDEDLVLWYRWVDVYLLTPVPPSHQINYRM